MKLMITNYESVKIDTVEKEMRQHNLHISI